MQLCSVVVQCLNNIFYHLITYTRYSDVVSKAINYVCIIEQSHTQYAFDCTQGVNGFIILYTGEGDHHHTSIHHVLRKVFCSSVCSSLDSTWFGFSLRAAVARRKDSWKSPMR